MLHSFLRRKELESGDMIRLSRSLRAGRKAPEHRAWGRGNILEHPGHRAQARAVAYCVGVGTNVSFDLELIRRYSTEVHAFDPTPVSLAWVLKQSFRSSFTSTPWDWRTLTATRVLPAARPEPCFPFERGTVRREGRTDCLLRAAAHNAHAGAGHKKLDLLKMDIEGSEYGVIDDLVREKCADRPASIEFHHRHPSIGMEDSQGDLDARGRRIQGLCRAFGGTGLLALPSRPRLNGRGFRHTF